MELEALAGEVILHRVGVLELSAPGNNHAQLARESASRYGIPFEWLSMDEVRRRYPQINAGDDWVGGFGDRGGFLDVVRSLTAMGREARNLGVEIRDHARVIDWTATETGVGVDIGGQVETADRAIITAGGWTDRLLAEHALPLRVLRKTLFWLEIDQPGMYLPDRLPVYIAGIPGYEFYGFPIWGQPGVKVAVHSGGDESDPDCIDREVSDQERSEIVDVARQVLRGVTGRVLHATTCMYTVSPDHDFIIDVVPGHSNVVFGTGFSGHGFKFAPAVGELLVQVLLGERETLPLFRLERFESGY
jgi:glycine/D-amino acid oxidase-like deaminating enzyme